MDSGGQEYQKAWYQEPITEGMEYTYSIYVQGQKPWTLGY